jgi:hypothetical protein
MKLNNRRAMAGVSMVALSVALLGACGGGSDDDSPDVASLDDEESSTDSSPDGTATETTTATDPEQAMLDFAECMRDHGIDMEDPQFDSEGRGGINLEATPENEDELEAAQEACQPLLEDAMGDVEIDPEQEAEMRQRALEFAQCMRDHGVEDFPDPVFEDGGFVIQGGAGEGENDPDFQAAQEACQTDEGPGGPGGGPAATDVSEEGD